MLIFRGQADYNSDQVTSSTFNQDKYGTITIDGTIINNSTLEMSINGSAYIKVDSNLTVYEFTKFNVKGTSNGVETSHKYPEEKGETYSVIIGKNIE